MKAVRSEQLKVLTATLLLEMSWSMSFFFVTFKTYEEGSFIQYALIRGLPAITYFLGSRFYGFISDSTGSRRIFMVIGAMNFYDIHNLVTGRFRELFRSEELKYYLSTITILPILTALSYVFLEGYPPSYGLVVGIFNSLSGITTTGFSIGSLSTLRDTTKMLFIIGMLIGGMTFSTAGGIKALRLMLIFRKLRSFALSVTMSSYTFRKITIKETTLSEADIANALLLAITHISMVLLGATLITTCNYRFIDALFEASSAAGCVGLSVGIISASSPVLVKIVIMFLMLAGRIEYLPLYLMLSLLFSRRFLGLIKW